MATETGLMLCWINWVCWHFILISDFLIFHSHDDKLASSWKISVVIGCKNASDSGFHSVGDDDRFLFFASQDFLPKNSQSFPILGILATPLLFGPAFFRFNTTLSSISAKMPFNPLALNPSKPEFRFLGLSRQLKSWQFQDNSRDISPSGESDTFEEKKLLSKK